MIAKILFILSEKKSKMRKIILFLSVFLFLSANLCMAQSKEEVQSFAKDISAKIFDYAGDTSISKETRSNKIAALLEENVDFQWIARFVLGKYWRKIDNQQKDDFSAQYKQYLLASYIPQFSTYVNGGFDVLKVNEMELDEYMVNTRYTMEDGTKVDLDFFVMQKDGRYYINDFVAEGISFITAQRTEIMSQVSQEGFDEFLNALKQKTETLKAKK